MFGRMWLSTATTPPSSVASLAGWRKMLVDKAPASFGQVLHLRSCPRYGDEVRLRPDQAGRQKGRRDGNGEGHLHQGCPRIKDSGPCGTKMLLRLAQVLPNIPEFPIAFLGAAGAGITVTTANPTYRLRLFVDCSMSHLNFLCASSPVYTCS